MIERGFKANGWELSDTIRRVLVRRDYWIAEHHKNHNLEIWSELPGAKIYCTCHEWCMHGHTWGMPTQDPVYRNGIRQFIEEHGLPFNLETKFHLIDNVVNGERKEAV